MTRRRWRLWAGLLLGALALLLALAAWVWREDILRTSLDPRVPYQTYRPPPAPDYASPAAWALLPTAAPGAADGPADIFFVHPTTFDGGRDWNAPVGDAMAARILERDMLPNHAGPYKRLGRVFAPRYRQASLYTELTLREDAREARSFAYGDARAAFRAYLERYNGGRPFLLVGVGQGGTLAARLLAEEIGPDPQIRNRLVAAHLIETVTPEPAGLLACRRPDETGCILAFATIAEGDLEAARRRLERALVWRGDQLGGLDGQPAICVNPLLGGGEAAEPIDTAGARPLSDRARLNKGAANATGLPWGERPALLRREVGAMCGDGVLYVSRARSPALQRKGGFAERRRARAFNLFYADLEADAARRLQAWLKGAQPRESAAAGAALRPPVEQLGQKP